MAAASPAAAVAANKAVKRVGKYEIGKTLGEGTFGKVKYAVNTETGEKVAIKILDKEKIQKQNMGAQIKKEISIMKMVKHENVVKLYEVLASRTKIFIVLELITGGELFDKIVAEGKFDENKARFYFRQLIKGVKYCHGQGVCHRDLKPENLLLDLNANLKISDFGLSALYTGSADDEGRATLLHTTCGTPNYVAPEVLNDKGYDGRAADVWSAGVILYVLLAGFLPFDEPHMSALFRKIQRAEYTYPSWFTPQVRRLLDKILIADPLKRAGLPDIEADPWFIGPDGLGILGADIPLQQALGITSAPAPAPSAGPSIGGVPLAHVPSAKEIEDAVEELEDEGAHPAPHQPAPGGAAAMPAHASPALHSSASTDSDLTGTPAAGAAAADTGLNAFEVINMFGGMALNRLLEVAPGAVAAAGGERRGPSASHPQFLSAQPAAAILAKLASALADMHADVRVDEAACKVKGVCGSSKGEISLVAMVHRLTDELHLVEIRRGKGDILEYKALSGKLRERVASLVAEPSAARL